MTKKRHSSDPIAVLKALHNEIQKTFNLLGVDPTNDSYDDLEIINSADPADELFIKERIISIANRLREIQDDIRYLERPVAFQGHLKKEKNGRYSVQNFEITSGLVVEIQDEDSEWSITSIEHNGEDYYAVSLGKDTSLMNRYCRLRISG